jgi:hypothetical protein
MINIATLLPVLRIRIFFAPWIRTRNEFFPDPESRIQPPFLVKFSYIIFRILLCYLYENGATLLLAAYSWNRKQQEISMCNMYDCMYDCLLIPPRMNVNLFMNTAS